MNEILTHKKIDQGLCGTPLALEEGFSQVELLTIESMAADDTGLVHGGFIFGLADYAAMIAVNHPNVVLGAADAKFLKPVRVHETVVAEARVVSEKGKKRAVQVRVEAAGDAVFEGEFTCFVLDQHVLS